MSVYGLKRATPRMKYQHMQYVMNWKSELLETQAKEQVRRLEERQARLMNELSRLDPDGWLAWFDDDNNVPAFGYINQRCALLEERIGELRAMGEHSPSIADGEVES